MGSKLWTKYFWHTERQWAILCLIYFICSNHVWNQSYLSQRVSQLAFFLMKQLVNLLSLRAIISKSSLSRLRMNSQKIMDKQTPLLCASCLVPGSSKYKGLQVLVEDSRLSGEIWRWIAWCLMTVTIGVLFLSHEACKEILCSKFSNFGQKLWHFTLKFGNLLI